MLVLIGALMLALLAGTAVAKSGKGTVTYNFHGIVTEVTDSSVIVDVKKGNKAGRTFIAANGASQTFDVTSSTKIEVEDLDATLADIAAGDEVKVQVKAPANATSPLTARQLEVEDEDDF